MMPPSGNIYKLHVHVFQIYNLTQIRSADWFSEWAEGHLL